MESIGLFEAKTHLSRLVEAAAKGEAFVIAKNDGKRIIPTIVFEDGSILTEPSNQELARKLGTVERQQADAAR